MSEAASSDEQAPVGAPVATSPPSGMGARLRSKFKGKDVAFWVYLASRILGGVMNVVVLRFLIQLMTRSDYGDWMYYKSVASMLMPILTLSLPAAMMRMYFDKERSDFEGKAKLVTTVFLLSMIGVCVLIFGANILYLGGFHGHNAALYLGVVAPGSLLLGYFNYLTRVRNNYWLYFFNQLISSVGFVALLAIAVGFLGPVRDLTSADMDRLTLTVVLFSASVWLIVLVNLIFYARAGLLSAKVKRLNKDEIMALVRFSAPLSGTFFLGWTLSSSDMVLLGNMSTKLQVADYALAVGIAETVTIITKSALTDWPRFYYAKMRDNPVDRDLVIAARVRRFLWMHIYVMIGVRLLAAFAYDLLDAEAYSAGLEYVDYLMLGNFFFLAGNIFAAGIGYVKKTYLTIVTFIVPGVLNVGLNLIFIPEFGARAASLTTLVSFVIFAIMSWVIGRRYYDFAEKRKLAFVIAIALVVGLFPLRQLSSLFTL
ncbi:MAG: polysaccharide biosynthesis C-terminal domain-containing protein [Myxococcales bacterium]|nr:polysaccharide biosynthesis C-terminal domain-containing protein [Myxococcales bacterium]